MIPLLLLIACSAPQPNACDNICQDADIIDFNGDFTAVKCTWWCDDLNGDGPAFESVVLEARHGECLSVVEGSPGCWP